MESFDGDWNEDDPRSLARRVERALRAVQEHADDACQVCGVALCGHLALFALVAGQLERPLCLTCLARNHRREKESFRDALAMFVQSKPCLGQGWRYANLKESFPPSSLPTCLWEHTDAALGTAAPVQDGEPSAGSTKIPAPDVSWDAEDMACGELVLELRIRMLKLRAGQVLHLRATDLAAPRDIPAWCRLTGETLIASEHPDYHIRRKDER